MIPAALISCSRYPILWLKYENSDLKWTARSNKNGRFNYSYGLWSVKLNFP